MKQTNNAFVLKRVQEFNRKQGFNCAQTTLMVLSEKFRIKLEPQIISGSTGLNGAGRYRAQCGLVEGMLIFLGIYLATKNEDPVLKACHLFASKFEEKFGSLSCSKLRPNGFNDDDPPHLCEELMVDAIKFDIDFLNSI